MPGAEVARALIAAAGAPLAAPSANRSGAVSPTCAEHVLADLGGRIALILDAGPCGWGVESTVVACLGGAPLLLRPGAVSREEIEAALGIALGAAAPPGAAPIAPGALASHYAPRARLHLNAADAPADAARLDFAGQLGQGDGPWLDLSRAGDLKQAAANLFAGLRSARRDRRGERSSSRRSRRPGSAPPSTTGCAAPPRRALLKRHERR